MEISNKKNENSSPNLLFSKTIKENQNFNTFEVFKMENKNGSSSFINGYLAIANNESKSIDIYKIYPKNNSKLIQTIKVNCKNIDFIKYFYDPYLKVNYLTTLITLINDERNILIWKIIDENKFLLISNYTDNMLNGGIIMSVKTAFFRFYNIIITKTKFILIIYYETNIFLNRISGYLDIIYIHNKDNKERLNFPEEVDNFRKKKVINVFQINRDTENYLGVLDIDSFTLLKILSNNFNQNSREIFDSNYIVKINFVGKLNIGEVTDGVLIQENNNEYLFTCHKYQNKYYILKTNIKYNQICYKLEININKFNSMIPWNANYLIFFEREGKNILLFNKRIGKIEKKLINKDKSLVNGKKININDNEELLFGTDGNGILNLWSNQN